MSGVVYRERLAVGILKLGRIRERTVGRRETSLKGGKKVRISHRAGRETQGIAAHPSPELHRSKKKPFRGDIIKKKSGSGG